LKLLRIAQSYRQVLDEAARKGSSPLEVLRMLIGLEAAARQQRALARRIREARLPPLKTLADYDFTYPKRIPKEALVRLFDCAFVDRHGCGVLMGPTGTGKTHLLTALAYVACEKGCSVRYTRVVDMLNHLTAAQINGALGKVLGAYVRPSLLLLDELGYLPIDKRGAVFDVDNTLATALIDRLMHHGEALVIQGKSYRMRDKDSDSPSA